MNRQKPGPALPPACRDWLDEALAQVKNRRARPEIEAELAAHLEDKRDYYLQLGKTPEEAQRYTLQDMGSARAAGAALDEAHPVRWGLWGLPMALALAALGWCVFQTLGALFELADQSAPYGGPAGVALHLAALALTPLLLAVWLVWRCAALAVKSGPPRALRRIGAAVLALDLLVVCGAGFFWLTRPARDVSHWPVQVTRAVAARIGSGAPDGLYFLAPADGGQDGAAPAAEAAAYFATAYETPAVHYCGLYTAHDATAPGALLARHGAAAGKVLVLAVEDGAVAARFQVENFFPAGPSQGDLRALKAYAAAQGVLRGKDPYLTGKARDYVLE